MILLPFCDCSFGANKNKKKQAAGNWNLGNFNCYC